MSSHQKRKLSDSTIEKQARIAAEAMAEPTPDKVYDMASRLKPKDLLKALELVADKVGPQTAIKHLYAQLPDPARAVPDLPRAFKPETEGGSGESLAQPRKTFPNTPESRLAKVYAKPHNVRQRLIEFADDKTHGVLWVQPDSPVWVGWTIWAKRNPNAGQAGWVLDGTYSWRGIRLK